MRRTNIFKTVRNTKTRIINIGTSFILVAMSLGGSLPLLLSQEASAATFTVCASGCSATTIQGAINAATPGDVINVAPGTYNEDVTINKDVSLVGTDGAANTTIVATDGNSTPMTFAGGVSGATVSGFTITHSYTPAELTAWNFNNNGVLFGQTGSNNTLENSTVTLSRNGIYINTTENNKVIDNIITNNRTGINMTGDFTNTTITGNTISDNWTEGLVMYGTNSPGINLSTVSLSGNTFDQNWYEQVLVKGPSHSQNSTFTGTLDLNGNTFTDSPVTYTTSNNPIWDEPGFTAQIPNTPGIGGTSTKPVTPLPTLRIYGTPGATLEYSPKTLRVGATEPYTTIQAAVDDAAAGDTIAVDAGTYPENLTIPTNVTLDGAGSTTSGTIIQPTSGNGITIAASGVSTVSPLTVENMRVTTSVANGNDGIYFDSAVSHVALDNVVAVNNNYGIEVHNLAAVSDISLTNVIATGNSVGFRVGTGGSVNGLTVTNSNFDSNTSDGWYITANSGSTTNQNDFTNINVSSTSFSNDTNKGIYAEMLDNATFDNITIDHSGYSGSYGSGFNINEKYGQYHNIVIKNSSVTNSGLGDPTNGTGLDIEARDDGGYSSNPATLDKVAVSNSTITGNQVGIRYGETSKGNAGPTNVTVSSSNLSGNISSGINNQTKALDIASSNWWGNASGPYDNVTGDGSTLDTNNGGTGSAVVGAVTYFPWCTTIGCSSNNSIPAVPTLTFPANNVYRHTSNSNYSSWSAVSDPGLSITYYYESAYDPGFTHIAYQSGPLTANTISNPGEPEGTYYWRVMACDQFSDCSAWSSYNTINISNSVPGLATNLTAKFQYDSQNVSNNSTLNITAKSGGNNLELLWNAPVSDWVTGYHILATFPDGSTQTFYQGANTNAWLSSYDGFGQHGNGKYSYQIVSVNPNGNSTASSTFTLYYDTIKPTVAFTTPTPANNSFVNGNFTVGYTAKDNIALKSVNVSLFDTNTSHSNHWVTTCYNNSNETTTSDSGTCAVNIPNTLADGTYYVQVGAQDQAGNWSINATDTIIIDRSLAGTPTNLTAKFQYDSQNVSNNSTLNITAKSGGNNLELLWNAPVSDWVTGYHILATFPDGSTQTFYQGANTNAWLSSYDGFGQHGNGKYSYQIVSVNPNGNSTASSTFTLYYDTKPPTASFTSAPADNSYVNGNFVVSGNAQDNVALNNVFFDVRSQNGSTWIAGCLSGGTPTYTNGTMDATLGCTINTSNLFDGVTYMLRIHANDNAGYGNVNSDSVRYFTFDNIVLTAPNLVSPSDNAVVNGSSLTNSWSAVPNAASYEYQSFNDAAGNSQRFDGFYPTTSKTATNVADGTVFYWRVRAVDQYGNNGPWSNGGSLWKVTVDNVAPAVPISALSDSTSKIITNGYINTKHFTFTLNDASSDVTRYQLKYWNNISGSPFYGSSHAWNSTDLSSYSSSLGVYNDQFTQGEGTHYFAFSACDAAGNCSAYSSPFVVTYDSTSPTTPTPSPTAGNYTTADGTQLVSLSSSDTSSGLVGIYYTTDGSTPNDTGNGTLYTGAFSVSGSKTIKAISYDNAGNASLVMLAAYDITATPVVTNFLTGNGGAGGGTGGVGGGGTGAGAGNGGIGGGAVLGASTTTPNTSNSNSNGSVKGASTKAKTNTFASTNTSNNKFLWLGWWWLPIVVAILLLLESTRRAINTNKKTIKK